MYWPGSFICSLKVVSKQQLDSSSERSLKRRTAGCASLLRSSGQRGQGPGCFQASRNGSSSVVAAVMGEAVFGHLCKGGSDSLDVLCGFFVGRRKITEQKKRGNQCEVSCLRVRSPNSFRSVRQR